MTTARNHIGSYRKHTVLTYPVSLASRLYSIFWGPALALFILFAIYSIFPSNSAGTFASISFGGLILATFYTLLRLIVAYALALIVSVPLAILATANRHTEKIFLPIFDILESIPILAFFPILILIFIKFNFLNGAAVFILFLTMLWNIVFTAVGGLKVIPRDIKDAAQVFGLRGFDYFKKITLPAIVPQLVTGSILAFAQGWNVIIVAEVLHTYIPNGAGVGDLFGIGSILVGAASSGENMIFLSAVILMTLTIAILNFLVWQKLLRYAERFKFD